MSPETTGPKQTGRRFAPGTSGNPSGRPRGSRHTALLALDRIGAEGAEDVMRSVLTAAKNGDMQAAGLQCQPGGGERRHPAAWAWNEGDRHCDWRPAKVDVEGFELSVFNGGIGTIRQFEPVLMVESLRDNPKLAKLLNGLGYDEYRFENGGFQRGEARDTFNSLLLTSSRLESLRARR